MSYLPSFDEKRFKSENGSGDTVTVAQKSTSLVQDDLAEKYKHANVKEFFIDGNQSGKVLACGVEEDPSPNKSRFRVRIYDTDRRRSGNTNRNYIEISLSLFEEIKKYEEQIKFCLIPQLRERKHIFHDKKFSLAVVPSNEYYTPSVEFMKLNIKIYMKKSTFLNMLSYEAILKIENAEYQRRMNEEKMFIDEIVNLMAWNRNEERVNNYVKEPADWYQAGTITTWKKLMQQIGKSKEKLRKKRKRLSDEA